MQKAVRYWHFNQQNYRTVFRTCQFFMRRNRLILPEFSIEVPENENIYPMFCAKPIRGEAGLQPRMQTVEKPRKSSRGPKPSRIPIVPGGVYGGDRAIFASGNLISQSKNRFIAVFAPGNPKDFSENWRGWQWRGSLLPRPPACQKDFFDKLNPWRSRASATDRKKLPGICIFLTAGCVQDHRDCMNASMRSTAFRMFSVEEA